MLKQVSIYGKIDENVKDRSMIFVAESKIVKDKKTDTFQKLLEEALVYYMDNHFH